MNSGTEQPIVAKIAFLTATFPALSETFVLREYCFLDKAEGVSVVPFAIRKASGLSRNSEYTDLEKITVYLRPNRLGDIGFYNAMCIIRRPVRYIKALGVLFRTIR